MDSLNGFDIFVLALVGLGIGMGLWKGLVKQIFYLGGIIIGYIAAGKFYVPVSAVFSKTGSNVVKAASFLGIFILCILLTSIAGHFLGKILKLGGLSWLNRLGGGFLGFVKALLIIIIVTTVLIAFLPSDSALLRNSVTLPHIISVTQIVNRSIPSEIKEKFTRKSKEIKNYWIEKQKDKAEEIFGMGKKSPKEKETAPK